ncbi:MAG TPA: zinc ribbon domain-containing protein [Anaerolineales bacterium]|nr:zinc ribbon domain-containing protein [Anaerolineales bacterium]
MSGIDDQLGRAFVCRRCDSHGARVERVAVSGTGISRLFEIQPYRYAFASCLNCGFTEVFDLKTLEGRDDVGTVLEVLFAD